ncbi:hypothetical protein B0A50_03509 [Salinomyces thailandicus]|uniref:Uncharacterized protein n=1 Tax=Salinomyces thailandicus TaxID=706561 RepID=A0A4U0U504_9PEZI|nr:hypothetical protein B0A50_03509 [Salinomyces thailandica]
MADHIAKALLSAINLSVSGASGPSRDSPIQCYYPSHQSYQREAANTGIPRQHRTPPSAAVPGGTPRAVESSMAKDGFATVYDRDIVTTWRLPSPMAAYEDVMFDDEHFDTEVALEELGNYLAGLGKQTVTVGLSAIEDDMVEEYRQMVEGLQLFSCSPHERLFIREFLSTRECFHFVEHRLPYVEATFHPNTVGQELAVEIHFKKVLPLLHFQDLRNVVGEGDWYSLKPRLSIPTSRLVITTDYFLGPVEEAWLSWIKDIQSFRGTVPQRRAAYSGAGRLDAYTIPLELKAVVTRHFPAGIRFEQVIRVALPLTVKRQPDSCGTLRVRAQSPSNRMEARKVNNDVYSQSPGTVRRIRRVEESRFVAVGCENEIAMPSKELNEALERKAASPLSSPTINPLALARYWHSASMPRQQQQPAGTPSRAADRLTGLHKNVGGIDDQELPSFQSDL